MKLVSVNVSLPREVEWEGRQVPTGIFKEPVEGPVMLRRLNLDGDRQGNLRVHGGPNKAVYGYPCEHYAFWRNELSRPDLSWGMFGENFTTEGLLEEEIRIGDQFQIGAAVVMVTQPRTPCFKLGIKFGDQKIVDRFLASIRSGFYFAVLQEGPVGSGEAIEKINGNADSLTVAEVMALHLDSSPDPDALRRLLQLEALPDGWKERMRKRMEKKESDSS